MQIQSFKEILPHWELSDSFTVIEAAALIAGVEPTSIDESLEWFRDKQSGFTVSDGIHEFTAALSILLSAIRSGSLKADSNTGHLKVISVERSDLVEWISSKGKRFRPAFFFPDDQDSEGFTTDPDAAHRLRHLEAENARLVQQVTELQRQLQEATAALQQAQPVEPEDLPDELSIASIAFRAVSNGYGDTLDTFRNRLGAYLDERHPGLVTEAKKRIVTVANQDKTPGRKGRATK